MIDRKIESFIVQMLKYFRIVAINGPRQSGKTTLQKKIAKDMDLDYYSFDMVDTYNTASEDSEGFISYITKDKSVAIDEIQMLPQIIPAVKIAVDNANKKGMFLLTGSSDMFKNSKIKESLAGRMVSVNLFPLSYTEINKKDINIIDVLFSDDFNRINIDTNITNEDFIKCVVNGGYPEVYGLPDSAKKVWFDFYIKSRITKDIASIENVDLEKISNLNILLKALSAQIGSLVNYKNISNSIGLADKTVKKYINLLEALYIVKLIPSYSSNALKKVIKSPKIHFIDTGLASYLLNANTESLMLGKNRYKGNLVENFVYTELIKHQSFSDERVEIYHFRDQQKKEVDFILESDSGDVVAIEVKSGTNLKKEHFKGLFTLANSLKEKNFKGIMLYAGDKILPFKFDDFTFWAIPLSVFV